MTWERAVVQNDHSAEISCPCRSRRRSARVLGELRWAPCRCHVFCGEVVEFQSPEDRLRVMTSANKPDFEVHGCNWEETILLFRG